jgi:hypothetical protein
MQQGQRATQGPSQVAMMVAMAGGAAVPGGAAAATTQALVSPHNTPHQDPLAEFGRLAAAMPAAAAAAQA